MEARIFAAEVANVADLTPHMRRLTVTAPELADYAATGPDEYLGLLIPPETGAPLILPVLQGTNIRTAVAAITQEHRPDLRWYTLRAHRPEEHEIDIDIVVHGDEGPGTRFARGAQPGDVLGIRESTSLYAPPPGPLTRVIVGDESAIPAIARILETTTADETEVFIEIADAAEQQDLPGNIAWIERAGQRPGLRLEQALRAAILPQKIDYAWVCAERESVQQIRRHLIDRGIAKEHITFSGYWRLGEARG